MQFSQSDFFIENKYRSYAWNMNRFHCHNSYEIYYMNSGKRTMLLEQKFYELLPGDVLLLCPNVPHKGAATDAHEKLGIEFSKKFLDYYFTEPMQKELLSCYKYNLIRLNRYEQQQFKALYSNIYSDHKNGGLYSAALAQMLVMLDNAGKKHELETQPQSFTTHSKRIRSILEYIEENYRNIKSIDEIAEYTYLDKSYLCRLFKKETNMTIMDYLYNCRIQQACERLASKNEPISLVAQNCGFENTSHFIKMFKSMLDCTPGQFRKEQLENKH